MADYLLYGANGYTGRLIAKLAKERGHRPLLAGRNAAAIGEMMAALDMPGLAFPLDRPDLLDVALREVRLVLHCAGPFSRTAMQSREGLRHQGFASCIHLDGRSGGAWG